MMDKFIEIKIDLLSPFLTGNAEAGWLQYDAKMLRNDDGKIVFPGTLIRGVLRDVCESMTERLSADVGLAGLSNADTNKLIAELFGEKSQAEQDDSQIPNISAFEPKSAKAFYGDLVSNKTYTPEKETQHETQPLGANSKIRIARSDLTEASVEGSLQIIEMVEPIGEVVGFTMRVDYAGTFDLEKVCKLIELAFTPIKAIGGSKSAGFGRFASNPKVTSEEDTNKNDDKLKTTNILKDDNFERLSLKLSLLGPLLISTQREGTNAFISDTIIPGGAIKAALAECLSTQELSSISEVLSEITISHGFPLSEKNADQYPVTLPKSLALYPLSPPCIADEAQNLNPILASAQGKIVSPIYAADQKYDQSKFVRQKYSEALASANVCLPDSDLARETRVRTSIDRKTEAAAMDGDTGQLFSQEVIQPWMNDDKKAKVEWYFTITSQKPGSIEKLIKLIDNAKIRIGKLRTKALLHNASDVAVPNPEIFCKGKGRVSLWVGLRTDTLMFNIADVNKHGVRKATGKYFQEVFGSELELEQIFTEQELAGGYQALRYRENETHYLPWILAKAGSVFVVSMPENKQDALLKKAQELLVTGLPLPECYKEKTWQTCPFIPQNGYGSVFYNPLPADALMPKDVQILQMQEASNAA